MSELEYGILMESLDAIDLICKDISKLVDNMDEDTVKSLQKVIDGLDTQYLTINKLTMDHEDLYGDDIDDDY